ncbi:putative glycoside hydrolase family 16 protein [Lyophyllum shimeji]|uniref:Glycoside hydrolase family 16 protein n=1 Tax=Lyophyllum shimeji TaxID=47721 RepID=A0A9P3PI19_LYOSH|nr:putative glycoside hydrolase family 16 protein [Lyophyllum shimeji]
MLLFRSLPLGLILLIADATPSSASLIPRAIEKLHGVALKHTKSLARDLRVAFGGILVAQQPPSSNTHAVYCKPGRSGSLGGAAAGNSTSSVSPSGTSRAGPSSTKSSSGANQTGSSLPSSPWKLIETHQGTNFYDGWTFFIGPDTPTQGIVEYVDEGTARANGLLEVNSAGNAIMRVETTPNVPDLRKSIRITTNTQFNGGLVVMDAVHMPTGCGTWPAFWTNGPNWPHGGEIDIVEAVHDYTNNQMTIHTDTGCRLPSSDVNVLKISGNVIGGTDCAALTTGNQGCGIRSSLSNSFGAGFNRNGGGTYAMQWDGSGISVFFFPRGSEPDDITNDVPRPETWGPAQARWPADSCDPFKFFSDHSAIFDTTLCGQWAGSVWNAAGIPGQEQSCAQRTGVSTCEAFVRANGAAFSEAYWEVRYVKIYQFKG